MKTIHVRKRSGELELRDDDKINKLVQFACEGVNDVSASMVVIQSKVKFYDGIPTDDIHEALIKTAADLITVATPNYQQVAAKLISYKLRKIAYRTYTPPTLLDHINRVVSLGFYDKAILELYTEDEINKLDKVINHGNDDLFTYAAMKQFEDKYLVRNRSTGEVLETPQMAYILVAMTLFSMEDASCRMELVKEYYKEISTGIKSTISLPTPISAGVRTPTRQFSSCVVLKAGDSIDSLNATTSAIVKYVSKRAGIGVDFSAVRPSGSPIRGGEATHTGAIPFIKYIQGGVKSSSQGAIRAGAATLYIPVWHREIEDLIVIKNNKGTEDNRARGLDYAIQLNGHFYKKAMAREEYCLFNPNEHHDLYEAFFNDQDLYSTLYDKLSKKKGVKKVDAFTLLTNIITERASTGRIYIMNVDHVNKQTSHKSTIYSSNLCLSGETIVTIKQDGVANQVSMKELDEIFTNHKNIMIKSYDENTDSVVWTLVEASAMTSVSAKVVKVTDSSSGQSIICTPDHEVYTSNRGYVKAGNLLSDDKLVLC
jgi:ribonucleoside-diphosphate reductase alpha chain